MVVSVCVEALECGCVLSYVCIGVVARVERCIHLQIMIDAGGCCCLVPFHLARAVSPTTDRDQCACSSAFRSNVISALFVATGHQKTPVQWVPMPLQACVATRTGRSDQTEALLIGLALHSYQSGPRQHHSIQRNQERLAKSKRDSP